MEREYQDFNKKRPSYFFMGVSYFFHARDWKNLFVVDDVTVIKKNLFVVDDVTVIKKN